MEITRAEFKQEINTLHAGMKDLQKGLLQAIHDQHRMTQDLVMQEIRASEARTDKKLGLVKSELEGKIDVTKREILTGVGEMIDESIVPELEKLDPRVTKLETKLA